MTTYEIHEVDATFGAISAHLLHTEHSAQHWKWWGFNIGEDDLPIFCLRSSQRTWTWVGSFGRIWRSRRALNFPFFFSLFDSWLHEVVTWVGIGVWLSSRSLLQACLVGGTRAFVPLVSK
jgi:hypothetical protein